MKLYYAPGTCSFAPHLVLREANLPFQLVRFDMVKRTLEDGRALTEVNPKGYVPVLELESGERLTEVSAILQYLADQAPDAGLAPRDRSLAHYRVLEWLNFLATEIHKIYWPIFHEATDAEKDVARARVATSYSFVEERLGDNRFLAGEAFGIVDAYLVTVLNWAKPGRIDLARWPKLVDYRRRILERPAAIAALEAEGLRRPAK